MAKKKSQESLRALKEKLRSAPPGRDFQKALQEPNEIGIIAEIKKASPSRGVIRQNFDPLQIAQCYEQQGAAAISILTEQKFFQGDLLYLKKVRQICALPLLCKDFIIDRYQLYEARLAGADAVLFIADVLSEEELSDFYAVASDLGLSVLLEVHDQKGLEKALSVKNPIIGINNRDLKTFQVDLATTAQLIPQIPPDRVIVSESGIHDAQQLSWLKDLGVDAVLVGEAFMAEEDIGLAFQKLRGTG